MVYLSEKEQYKKSLNREEISLIKDAELREIRQKYWDLRQKAFLDEKNISDRDLGKIFDDLYNDEKIEIENYKTKAID